MRPASIGTAAPEWLMIHRIPVKPDADTAIV
jgi:hypothetical protein